MGKCCQPREAPATWGRPRGPPGAACPTHRITLLFLGNVYIPDTLLSPQGFSRLCIFYIAEQEPGLERVGVPAVPLPPPSRYSHLEGRLCPWQRTGPAGAHIYVSQNSHSLELSSPGRPQHRASFLDPLVRAGGQAAVGFAKLSPHVTRTYLSLLLAGQVKPRAEPWAYRELPHWGSLFLQDSLHGLKEKKNLQISWLTSCVPL